MAGECGASKTASTTTATSGNDIVAVAAGAGSFNTLVAAVKAAGLVETLTLNRVPPPSNRDLAVGSVPAGQFAVMRFSGGRSPGNESNAVATLTVWMKREQLAPTGTPMFGYFDPPWTPIILRRNEVMLRVAPAK